MLAGPTHPLLLQMPIPEAVGPGSRLIAGAELNLLLDPSTVLAGGERLSQFLLQHDCKPCSQDWLKSHTTNKVDL